MSSIVGAAGLNLLINNAGMTHKGTDEDLICTEMMAEVYAVNTISPLVLTKTLLPLLNSAATAKINGDYSIINAAVVNMSSYLGSIELNSSGSAKKCTFVYRCSKARIHSFISQLIR